MEEARYLKFKWLPRASNQQPITSDITLVPRTSSKPFRQYRSKRFTQLHVGSSRSVVFYKKGVVGKFALKTFLKQNQQNQFFLIFQGRGQRPKDGRTFCLD